MSLVFSNPTTKNGIIQGIERTLFGDAGDTRISGNTTLLARFTGEINIALDKAITIALTADGTWQFDDTNHTDYPEITTTLTSGTRRYSLTNVTADAGSNLNLEVYKVFVKDASGTYIELEPVDVQSGGWDNESFFNGIGTTGVPSRYDKTGKWIDLDPIPNYTVAQGIKVLISREGSYFTVADTTKKPGIQGNLHEYFVLRPSYIYARNNGMAIAGALKADMEEMERRIEEAYSHRAKDERKVLRGNITAFK